MLPQSIQGLQKENPRLYEAFKEIFLNIERINKELFPLIVNTINQTLDVAVFAPTGFMYTILPRAISFDWDDAVNANGYEIRLGDTWETSSFVLRTISSEAVINPVVAGTYNYLIKTINRAGNYSSDTTSLSVTINGPQQVNLSISVIDNNVLLNWEAAISDFQVDYYVVSRDGVERGRVNGTFIALFENAGGEYIYTVYAVDIAGNIGTPNSIVALVNQPPDFVLEDTLVADLSNPEDEDNTELVEHNGINKILVCVIKTETWQQHFDNNSWTTIQQQVDAGYPIYAQPAESSGYFEYIFDFGAIFSSVIIGTTWVEEVIDGDINITVEISYSDDNISYTSPVSGISLFATSMRYAKIRLIFAPDDDTSLSLISFFTGLINVKREMDGGNVDVLAADTTGTVVEFNKAFKDIESITVTPLSTVEQVAIYDFVDVPNPTEFKILLFDAGGSRVDGTVSWIARGVM